MSTRVIREANLLVTELDSLIRFLTQGEGVEALASTRVNWETGEVLRADPTLVEVLTDHDLVEHQADRLLLTRSGMRTMGRLLLDLDALIDLGEPVGGKFEIRSILARGRNSVAFLATHTLLRRDVVLKFIRPGSSEGITSALYSLGEVEGEPYLVHPIDYLRIPHVSVSGDPVTLDCIVFPYVEGRTLEDYLRASPPLSPYFFEAFIRQIATGLKALEDHGAYHGDLHGGNILVIGNERSEVLQFRLIDLSYGVTSPSRDLYEANDLDMFRQHLWRGLTILQQALGGVSVPKHLGARLYEAIRAILTAESLTFDEVLYHIDKNPAYRSFSRRKESFLRDKFSAPQPLGLLRYEEITDPAAAAELFEPYPELMNLVETFGNTLLYGPRGSGKSSYLASLAFFPHSRRQSVDFREIFGVLISCRQGEFKQFSRELIDFSPENVLRIKHVLVLRIIRRVVATLASAVEYNKLSDPHSVDALYRFLERFVQDAALAPYSGALVSAIGNLSAALARFEIREMDDLFGRNRSQRRPTVLLDEVSLRQFLKEVRNVFAELSRTQFYILLDDAGEPNIPRETQKILNSVVRSVNPIYCVKLSAERFSYDLQDISGKVLEEGHDISTADISHTLAVKDGIHPERKKLERYFRSIIKRRLEYWRFQSTDIIQYLGQKPIPTRVLVARLAHSRRNAYFAGWDVVWQIADQTARSLLELITEVFAAAEVTPESPSTRIRAQVQHEAIKKVSERKLKALSYTPGRLSIGGRTVSRGRHLYEFATAFGGVARAYLVESKLRIENGSDQYVEEDAAEHRYDERLAIERNDSTEIHDDAKAILDELVRFGVVDDSRLVQARDDRLHKPIYIFNRIFCPAFKISYRRDSHLRLSRSKFELFLTDPIRFSKVGTQRLTELEEMGMSPAPDLFDEFDDE